MKKTYAFNELWRIPDKEWGERIRLMGEQGHFQSIGILQTERNKQQRMHKRGNVDTVTYRRCVGKGETGHGGETVCSGSSSHSHIVKGRDVSKVERC
jgi:hypothetical protein